MITSPTPLYFVVLSLKPLSCFCYAASLVTLLPVIFLSFPSLPSRKLPGFSAFLFYSPSLKLCQNGPWLRLDFVYYKTKNLWKESWNSPAIAPRALLAGFVLLTQCNINFTLWREKWGLREPEHSAVVTQWVQDRTPAEVSICPSPQPEF